MSKRNETRDAPVNVLVQKLKDGEIKLPEMQRDYVWNSTQVRDLMDSLYRGYPSLVQMSGLISALGVFAAT